MKGPSCTQQTALLLLSILWISSCQDSYPLDTESGDRQIARSLRQGPEPAQQVGQHRKNTPWQALDNGALAQEVARFGGRVLIGLKDSAAFEGVDNSGRVLASPSATARGKQRLRELGAQFEYEFKQTPVVVARVSSAIVAQLRSDPYVDYIEPDAPGSWEQQVIPWNITQVQAPSAWSPGGATGLGVKLGLIDSGVYRDPQGVPHRDIWLPVAWRCISGPIDDQFGHGTHVGGIAAAWYFNNLDVAGVAHQVHMSSANVDVGGFPSSAEVACSIEVARNSNIFVINMSIGLTASTAVTDQINAGYYQNGMVFVASAGNTNGGPVTYPANRPEVIAVTATDINNVRANFAAIGSQVELAAPGVIILSTSHPNGSACTQGGFTGLCSGTSMAAPHVAAAAALVKGKYPSWSNIQVRNRLVSTALPLGPANQYGAGLLRAFAAVQ